MSGGLVEGRPDHRRDEHRDLGHPETERVPAPAVTGQPLDGGGVVELELDADLAARLGRSHG
ncbi:MULTISPECIES: hypothetical protein [unclassified Streptomyces]|uniref:hypothetical protein n=1 Tax=unclassified Streptomyces TaxID=2593676 RepID=UPI000938EA88|nr:hypothetical protein [Streptomyces sp. CB02058]OKI88737.1 hypothetical protein AMK10_30940 [Streptomyces sp. CB02058]